MTHSVQERLIPMWRLFKELPLTVFTLFFRLAADAWTPGINASKGVFGVTILEGAILVGVAAWIRILFGIQFFFNSDPWTIRISALALYFANYFFLVTRKHGILFEREFSNVGKSRRIILLAGSSLVFLAAIVFCAYSGYTYRNLFSVSGK